MQSQLPQSSGSSSLLRPMTATTTTGMTAMVADPFRTDMTAAATTVPTPTANVSVSNCSSNNINNSNRCNERLKQIDAALHNLSDGATMMVQVDVETRREFWQQIAQQQKQQQQIHHPNEAAAETSNERMNRANHDNSLDLLKAVTKLYAPCQALQKPFQDLYRVLHPCLVQRLPHSNASAFLQGARGTGKSAVLQAVLQACRDQVQLATSVDQQPSPNASSLLFRVVQLDGTLVPGHPIAKLLQEILRQLSNMALQEHQSNHGLVDPSQPDATKKQKRSNTRLEELLRLRQTSFTNHIQLLNEILQLASVDGIPVLFVLEELDAFVGGISRTPSSNGPASHSQTAVTSSTDHHHRQQQQQQVLLYHLLDRVATAGSFCSLVGITAHPGSTLTRLEKRIRSRVEGTAQWLYFGVSMTGSLHTLLHDNLLLKIPTTAARTATETSMTALPTLQTISLRQEVAHVLLSSSLDVTTEDSCINTHNYSSTSSPQRRRRIRETLQRDYHMGKSPRWFSRVLAHALTLHRHDAVLAELHDRQGGNKRNNNEAVAMVRFESRHVLEAMMDLGASFLSESGQRDLVLLDVPCLEPTRRSCSDRLAVLPRMQMLRDLSGPQLSLLLAARRILVRDSGSLTLAEQRCGGSGGVGTGSGISGIATTTTKRPRHPFRGCSHHPAPCLTLQRMLDEYHSTYKGSTNRYSNTLLRHAFDDMLQCNVFRSAIDHVGTGPLQYAAVASSTMTATAEYAPNKNNKSKSLLQMDAHAMYRLPLHLTVDVYRELGKTLQQSTSKDQHQQHGDIWLHGCSTALLEWGRKTN